MPLVVIIHHKKAREWSIQSFEFLVNNPKRLSEMCFSVSERGLAYLAGYTLDIEEMSGLEHRLKYLSWKRGEFQLTPSLLISSLYEKCDIKFMGSRVLTEEVSIDLSYCQKI